MESTRQTKSDDFTIRIVKLTQYLQSKKKEFLLGNQPSESGPSIGALIRETKFIQSHPDFKINLKVANEPLYLLNLLQRHRINSHSSFFEPGAK